MCQGLGDLIWVLSGKRRYREREEEEWDGGDFSVLAVGPHTFQNAISRIDSFKTTVALTCLSIISLFSLFYLSIFSKWGWKSYFRILGDMVESILMKKQFDEKELDSTVMWLRKTHFCLSWSLLDIHISSDVNYGCKSEVEGEMLKDKKIKSVEWFPCVNMCAYYFFLKWGGIFWKILHQRFPSTLG